MCLRTFKLIRKNKSVQSLQGEQAGVLGMVGDFRLKETYNESQWVSNHVDVGHSFHHGPEGRYVAKAGAPL